jgi:hypothetical protein
MLLCCLCAVSAAASDDALTVVGSAGKQGQAIATSYWLDVSFSNPGNASLRREMHDAVVAGWNCTAPENYLVTVEGSPTPLPVDHIDVSNTKDNNCLQAFEDSNHFPKLPAVLQVKLTSAGQKLVHGKVTVHIQNLPKGSELQGTSKDAISWTPNIIMLSVQSVLNENLTNKTVAKDGVYQFGVTGSYPLKSYSWGGILLDSKNLFSTNERDAKSAFSGGGGVQVGLSRGWYIPLKFEQQMQGNQVATNLSAVSLLEVSSLVPGWKAVIDLDRRTIGAVVSAPNDPLFKLDFPYTHRINQLVAAKASPLPENDFAVNPSFTFSNGHLLGDLCNQNTKGTSGFNLCLNWEADAGLYYLPLENTARGSQRVEGYWDSSLLVPFSKLPAFAGIKLDPQSQQMQLRIKYGDTVNPANNYARSKKWSFGLELVKQ